MMMGMAAVSKFCPFSPKQKGRVGKGMMMTWLRIGWAACRSEFVFAHSKFSHGVSAGRIMPVPSFVGIYENEVDGI
jgi:hypothetical protein